MGKLHEETTIMANKMLAPTIEQLRMAQFCSDKGVDDMSEIKEKCRKIVEMTKCEESAAQIALYDCNQNLEEAIDKILEGCVLKSEEWHTTGKKPKKALRDSDNVGDHRNHQDSTTFDDQHSFIQQDRHDSSHNGGGRRRDFGDGGPAGRGRGAGGFRGGRSRGRGVGFGSSNENNDNEHSTDRSSRGRSGQSFKNFNGDHSRPGRNDYRGSSSRKHQDGNNEAPAATDFECSITNWNNDTSNTWNNNMARTGWSSERGAAHTNSGGTIKEDNVDDGGNRMVVDQWKDPNRSDAGDQKSPANTGGGADDVRSHQQGRRYDDRRGGGRPGDRRHGTGGHQHRLATGANMDNGPNGGKHADDWNHDDWGEEEDWQNMTNRVFTNINVQQQTVSQQSSNATSSAYSHGGMDVSKVASSVANEFSTSAAGDSSAVNHRGESIDVNLLFGQQSKPDASETANNDPASGGSWSKQATDTLKNELGIGKLAQANIDQMNQHVLRTPRQYPAQKTLTSKVEMPNSVPSIGQLDVEFGEFSSLKMRSNVEEQQNYFSEFGTSAPYNSSDHMPQQQHQLKDLTSVSQCGVSSMPMQQQVSAPTLYQRTPTKDQHGAEKEAHTNNDNMPPGYGLQQQQQQVAQQQRSQSGMTSNLPSQQTPQQRVYMSNNVASVVSSSEPTNTISQTREYNMPSVIAQTYGSHGYNTLAMNRNSTTTNSTGKPQMNPATIFNPATQSYQALAPAAMSMPYIYPHDQPYLNAALQFAAGYPYGAMGTMPFDLSSLNIRDTTQQSINNLNADVKQYGNRVDANLLAAVGANSLNAPPGLGGSGAADHQVAAAQLLTQAAAAAAASSAYHHPYQLLPAAAPFYAPFVMPTVTNASASTANSVNQYNKNSGMFASQPMFYGSGDLQLAQDYGKNVYGMNVQQPVQNQNQNKQQSNANLNMSSQDMSNKAYNAQAIKAFQQSTATPPPGIGNVNFSPAPAFHAAQGAAAYGAYPQFMPHQISMIPPNMAAAQTQAVNPNDQRVPSSSNKGGANIYANKNTQYWTS